MTLYDTTKPRIVPDPEIALLVFLSGARDMFALDMIATIFAESGGDAHAVHVNTGGTHPGSKDLGLCQWNDFWHPDMEPLAFNPSLAIKRMMLAWVGGKAKEWNTYAQGLHVAHRPRAWAAMLNAYKHVEWIDQDTPRFPDIVYRTVPA